MKALFLLIPAVAFIVGCATYETSRRYYDEAWYQSQALPQGTPAAEPHQVVVVRDSEGNQIGVVDPHVPVPINSDAGAAVAPQGVIVQPPVKVEPSPDAIAPLNPPESSPPPPVEPVNPPVIETQPPAPVVEEPAPPVVEPPAPVAPAPPPQ